jgi:hypothetical protein
VRHRAPCLRQSPATQVRLGARAPGVVRTSCRPRPRAQRPTVAHMRTSHRARCGCRPSPGAGSARSACSETTGPKCGFARRIRGQGCHCLRLPPGSNAHRLAAWVGCTARRGSSPRRGSCRPKRWPGCADSRLPSPCRSDQGRVLAHHTGSPRPTDCSPSPPKFPRSSAPVHDCRRRQLQRRTGPRARRVWDRCREQSGTSPIAVCSRRTGCRRRRSRQRYRRT